MIGTDPPRTSARTRQTYTLRLWPRFDIQGASDGAALQTRLTNDDSLPHRTAARYREHTHHQHQHRPDMLHEALLVV